MYTFNIKAGTMTTDSGVTLESNCVAGFGIGLNNPAMCDVRDIGPLPVGLYAIQPAYRHPVLGPLTMDLTPYRDNEMYGRSLFRIHGFAEGKPKTSSHGCPCAEHDTREFINDHLKADNVLRVVAGE